MKNKDEVVQNISPDKLHNSIIYITNITRYFKVNHKIVNAR